MNKILSWKIKSGIYAYIYIPNSDSYISKRIPEDSPLWETIIGTISGWDISEYKENFDKMSSEVSQKYGKTISWDENYFNFNDKNSFGNVNIVMLSGESGDVGDENGGIIDDGEEDVFDKFNEMIQAEIDAMAAEINAKNEEVKAFVEKKVTETVADAKNTINQTVEALCAKTESAMVQLSNASEALDKAAALFEMGEGGITAEQLQNVLTSVDEYGDWMSAYSGNVINMWADYDAANREIGSVGEAVDGKKGLFTRIGTHIDTINATIGNVKTIADASMGLAETSASWINENAGTVTNAKSWLDASAATIGQTVDFIDVDGSEATSLSSLMNALSGSIIDTAMKMDESGITNVTREMNASLGVIRDEITNLSNDVDGTLTSLGQEMNAMSASMQTWITQEYSGTVKDLRDSWDTVSGMVRTVADLTIKTDEHGPIAYTIEDVNAGIEGGLRVYKPEYIGKISDHPWINIDGSIGYEDTQVVGEYVTEMMSYITQAADEVVMSVVNDTGKTAAIRLAIADDTATMGMIADKIIMSGNVIMGAMSALTANIGGILIGNGEIKTIKGVDDSTGIGSGQTSTFHLDGRNGKITATDADIRGRITADNGYIGGFEIGDNVMKIYSGDTIDNKILNGLMGGAIKHNDKQLIMAAGTHKYIYAWEQNGYSNYGREIFSTQNYSSNTEKDIVFYDSYTILDDGFFEGNIAEGDFTIENDGEIVKRIIDDIEIVYIRADELTLKEAFFTDANTKLYSDGTFETKILNADGGFFRGDIDSGGLFYGNLSGATGTLENIEINSGIINCDVDIKSENSIRANGNSGVYFTVKNTNLSNVSLTPETYTINPFYWYRQNSNGKNAGITYTGSAILSTAYFKAGATITFNTINGYIHRYAPAAKTNGECTVTLKRKVEYFNENNTVISEVTKSQTKFKGGGSLTTNIEFKFDNLYPTHDGKVTIELYFSCHLSTYSWLGLDKSSGTINLYGSSINVSYTSPIPGMFISPNGFRIVTPNNDALFSVIDGTIRLRVKNGRGIIIDENGIKLYHLPGETSPTTNIEYVTTRNQPYDDIFMD